MPQYLRLLSTLTGAGCLLFSGTAFAGECNPMEVVKNVDTIFYFEMGRPDDRKTISKTMIQKKVCGTGEMSPDRYVICLSDQPVLVLRSQFILRPETSIPPAPQQPSNDDHAGVLAMERTPRSDSEGEMVDVLPMERTPLSDSGQEKAVASALGAALPRSSEVLASERARSRRQNIESGTKVARPPVSAPVDNPCACKTALPSDCQ
jgi:hypothetical protein